MYTRIYTHTTARFCWNRKKKSEMNRKAKNFLDGARSCKGWLVSARRTVHAEHKSGSHSGRSHSGLVADCNIVFLLITICEVTWTSAGYGRKASICSLDCMRIISLGRLLRCGNVSTILLVATFYAFWYHSYRRVLFNIIAGAFEVLMVLSSLGEFVSSILSSIELLPTWDGTCAELYFSRSTLILSIVRL